MYLLNQFCFSQVESSGRLIFEKKHNGVACIYDTIHFEPGIVWDKYGVWIINKKKKTISNKKTKEIVYKERADFELSRNYRKIKTKHFPKDTLLIDGIICQKSLIETTDKKGKRESWIVYYNRKIGNKKYNKNTIFKNINGIPLYFSNDERVCALINHLWIDYPRVRL